MIKAIFVILTSLLFFTSIILNMVFYGLWNQEKTAHTQIASELHRTSETLKSVKANSPEQLKEVAEDFSKTLFTYDKLQQEERKNHLTSLVSKSLAKKLFVSASDESDELLENQNTNITSQAVIKDSLYNQTGNDTAKVMVTVEQTLVANDMQSKTIQDIQVNLKYNGKKWIVISFSTRQSL